MSEKAAKPAIPTRKLSPRDEFRKEQSQRVLDSASLAEKFRKLKSLTVKLTIQNSARAQRVSEIKYTVNLTNARSVFRFDCGNHECVGGDFDLSDVLAAAVAARRKTVVGEATCQGWRSKDQINVMRCLNVLHYKFGLKY